MEPQTRKLKKFLILPLSVAIISLQAVGQPIKGTPALLKAKKIKLPPGHSSGMRLPFRSIQVSDRRFDTSKIGYYKVGDGFRKMITENGLQADMQFYLNSRHANKLQPSASYDLLIVIKHLWLQETKNAEEFEQKIIVKRTFANSEFCQAVSGFELYAVNESTYIPLLRVDSVFQWNGVLQRLKLDFLTLPFENCLTKLAATDFPKKINQGRKLTLAEIETHYNQRFQHPKYNSQTLEKGVYLTFGDFLNNKPANKDFTVEFGKLTDELYVLENGRQTVLEKFWGFCDGEKDYIKIGYNLFVLYKEVNAYDVWGSKTAIQHFRRPGQTTGPAYTPTSKKVTIVLHPMQLNMETGQVY